jgi:hypothetical protein
MIPAQREAYSTGPLRILGIDSGPTRAQAQKSVVEVRPLPGPDFGGNPYAGHKEQGYPPIAAEQRRNLENKNIKSQIKKEKKKRKKKETYHGLQSN